MRLRAPILLATVVLLLSGALYLLMQRLGPSQAPGAGSGGAVRITGDAGDRSAAQAARENAGRPELESAEAGASAAGAKRRDAASGVLVRTVLAGGGAVPQVGVRAVRPAGAVPADPAAALDASGGSRASLAEETYALTDAEGRALLDLSAGTWILRAETLSVMGKARVLEVVGDRQQTLDLVLPADPWSWFYGRAVAAESGAPIADAEFAQAPFRSTDEPLAFEPVGSGGAFRTRMVGFERRWFELRAPGYAPRRFAPPAVNETSERDPFVVELHAAGTLELTARDPAGAPVGGVVVEARVASRSLITGKTVLLPSTGGDFVAVLETDDAGRVTFEGLPRERVALANLTGGDRRSLATFDLARGRRSETVVVGAGALVEGSVHDERGKPLAGRDLRMVLLAAPFDVVGPPDEIAARSDATGRFAFRDVKAGSWRMLPRSAELAKQALEVEVAPGQERVAVRYDLWSNVRLAGVVLDPDGAPAGGVDVIGQRIPQGGSYTAQTDAQGRFVLEPLGPGRLRVFARRIRSGYGAESSSPLELEVEPDLGSVELRLESR